MPTPYAYIRVDPPDIDPRSCIINVSVPAQTLGIEITDSLLASLCDLGNIDPQHGNARGPDVAGRAAIDTALRWPLPPPGTALATIRPDADSIGAMAVLSLRAEGVAFTPEMHARIDLIARSDCYEYGDWASWAAAHPPPQKGATLLALSPHPSEFRALAACVGLHPDDLPISVSMMRDWLLTGALPPHGMAEVEETDRAAAAAWSAGQLPLLPLCDGRVAFVQSDYPGAISLGYRHAPIVIAERLLGGKRKITIAQFERGHLDMKALFARLNQIEPGWGGSETILGSPQGRATHLKIEQIIDLIEEIGVMPSQ
jgi:hypothetical protein